LSLLNAIPLPIPKSLDVESPPVSECKKSIVRSHCNWWRYWLVGVAYSSHQSTVQMGYFQIG
jgi:hypothetical protein